MPAAGPRGWTPPGCCRGSPGWRCTTRGRPTTPTRTSPTHCATRTRSGSWSTSWTPPPAPVAALATQAIDAMVDLKDTIDVARDAGREPDPAAVHDQQRLLRSAVVLGRTATAARSTKLERK